MNDEPDKIQPDMKNFSERARVVPQEILVCDREKEHSAYSIQYEKRAGGLIAHQRVFLTQQLTLLVLLEFLQ